MRKYLILLHALFAASFFACNSNKDLPAINSNEISEKIVFYTEDYPPLNFIENGALKGLGVETVLALFKQTGEQNTISDIRLVPWARAYATVASTKNTAIFSIVRTKKRENDFFWVGPFAKTKNVLVAPRSLHLLIKDKNDLRKYHYGAVRKDIGEELLLLAGVNDSQIEKVNTLKQNIDMLIYKRIEIISCEEMNFYFNVRKNMYKESEFEIIYTFNSTDIYIGFNKNISPAVIAKYQRALDAFLKSEEYRVLLKKYQP
jgi:polar amino acid transport system substrate-binding protein